MQKRFLLELSQGPTMDKMLLKNIKEIFVRIITRSYNGQDDISVPIKLQ